MRFFNLSNLNHPIFNHPIFKTQQHAFPKLLAYRIFMVLAYQIIAVTVGWHIYELTHDPLALGLVGLAEVIPYFCFALFAGHAVDHLCSRRFFGILAACMLLVNALVLTAVSLGWLASSSIVWIYASIAFTGIARAFIAPSYSTLFAIILPREHYARASGFGTAVFQIGLVVGPAMGGLLIGYANKTAAYAVASALFLLGALTLATLKVAEPPAQQDAPTVFTSIGDGLKFVLNNQVLLGAQMLDMFAVLFGGAVALLPVFIHEVYQTGPETLGILRAMPSVGGILAGVYLTRHPINIHAGRWLLTAVAAFGLCMIAFAFTTHFWLAAFILFLSGAFDGVSVVLRSTIMQLATPNEMRGRVSAINGIFIGSSNELGAFESGLMARLMGLVPSVVFGGLMTLGVVGATAQLAPKLRNLELQQLQ